MRFIVAILLLSSLYSFAAKKNVTGEMAITESPGSLSVPRVERPLLSPQGDWSGCLSEEQWEHQTRLGPIASFIERVAPQANNPRLAGFAILRKFTGPDLELAHLLFTVGKGQKRFRNDEELKTYLSRKGIPQGRWNEALFLIQQLGPGSHGFWRDAKFILFRQRLMLSPMAGERAIAWGNTQPPAGCY